jgi:Transport and Golgi organisation 2
MCTVIYMPGEDCQYFASIRDENPQRRGAFKPSLFETDAANFIAPLDGEAGGTWIGANDLGTVIILLNGAHQNHEKKPGYRLSRGLIVRELLASELPVIDWSMLELDNIEPFTLIVWTDHMLFELVWDGEHRHRTKLDQDEPHIWSSSTLYDTAAKEERTNRFMHWTQQRPVPSSNSVMRFFESFNDRNNGFLMHRGPSLQSLSYTFIETNGNNTTSLHYHDLLSRQTNTINISLKTKVTAISQLFGDVSEN